MNTLQPDFLGSMFEEAPLEQNLGFLGLWGSSATYESKPILAKGAKGDAVAELQQKLGGLAVDGDFGPNTENRLKAYQGANGLQVTGVADPPTWAKLLGETYKGNTAPAPSQQAQQVSQTPAPQSPSGNKTAQAISAVSDAASNILSQFIAPPAAQQQALMQQPVTQAPATKSFPWMWVAGGIGGLVVVGGVLYFATRRKE